MLVFFISYSISLFLWLQAKDSYTKSLTYIASNITALVKDVEFKYIEEDKDKKKAVFFIFRKGKGWKLFTADPANTRDYPFYTPLTLAIMAVFFWLTNKNKRVYFYAILLLLSLHTLYIVILQIEDISWFMVQNGFEKASLLNRAFWPFLWLFFLDVVKPFEPFLVGAYIYLMVRPRIEAP